MIRRSLLLLLLLAPSLPGQTATQPTVPTPAYDVVSIVPNKTDSGSTEWSTKDATFTAKNLSVKMFVSFAFDLRQDLITGLPGWADTAHFDIAAKIVDPDLPSLKKLTQKQRNAMLVAILNDRFGFKAHTEQKQLPVYNLVVVPSGAKLKASAIQELDKGSWFNNDGEFTGSTIGVAALADFLANDLHRTVLDKTGLTAFYDLHLTWAPEHAAAAGIDDGRKPTADTGPSIFSALQDQLGLKLVPTKGPVETLVVDHVESPTPN